MQQNGFPERFLGQGAEKIAFAQKKPGENRMPGAYGNAAGITALLSLLAVCYGNVFRAAAAGGPLGEAPGSVTGLATNQVMNLAMSQVTNLVMSLATNPGWAIGDIGLFYLAMYFAYHTALRHETPRSMEGYWPRTIGKIGAQVACINALLLVWFLFQEREGLFTLQTLAALPGLSGFSSWFRIRDPGPFGADQWFITLLLLFYLAYPFINRHCRQAAVTSFALIAFGHAAMAGQFFFQYEHALWSTAFGFMAGFYLCRNKPPLRKPLVAAVVSVIAMAVFKLAGGGTSVTAYAIIAMLGLILGLLTLPRSASPPAGKTLFSPGGIFLPLFLLHTHFFMHAFTPQPHLNALIILACNAALAAILSVGCARFENVLFSRPPASTPENIRR